MALLVFCFVVVYLPKLWALGRQMTELPTVPRRCRSTPRMFSFKAFPTCCQNSQIASITKKSHRTSCRPGPILFSSHVRADPPPVPSCSASARTRMHGSLQKQKKVVIPKAASAAAVPLCWNESLQVAVVKQRTKKTIGQECKAKKKL